MKQLTLTQYLYSKFGTEYNASTLNDELFDKYAIIFSENGIQSSQLQFTNYHSKVTYQYFKGTDVANISLMYSDSIYITKSEGEENNNVQCTGGLYKKAVLDIVVFGDNNTIYCSEHNKLTPLSIKKFAKCVSKCIAAKELSEAIFRYYSE